ncbi:hypothetical protein [Crassaminicella profunda]|uniref:hypothetical protein n=1 Tax=Crassaminicella profunda TaxID=1286698 RepID=UPI001CA649FB|nr:hypothetical protein [Crassaminicella profunda]QZY56677.1 hypothetical protein K7H06_07080 [Crassaminicella profunda]
MARLPIPKIVQVNVELVEDGEERWNDFKSILRKAIDRRYIAEQKSKGETKDTE